MRVLLTAFEPFNNQTINPSLEILRALKSKGIAGVELVTAVLPCVDLVAERTLIGAYQEHDPEAVVCLGQGYRLAALVVEQVYSNLKHYRIPDNAGNEPQHQQVVPGGPGGYLSTLPIEPMIAACRAAGVPSWDGRDAGRYLCNQVSYALLHHLSTTGHTIPAGFVHVPMLPEQVVGLPPITPSMSAETASNGVEAMIIALAEGGRV